MILAVQILLGFYCLMFNLLYFYIVFFTGRAPKDSTTYITVISAVAFLWSLQWG